MQAFAGIGISFCFPTFATPAMLREIRAAVPGRLMVLDLPEVEDVAEWSGLADLVLNYPFCNPCDGARREDSAGPRGGPPDVHPSRRSTRRQPDV
jgi:hypothetical protein